MKFLTYRVTATPAAIPSATPIHQDMPRGLAYETTTHFVHMYSNGAPDFNVSAGMTVTEKKSGLLDDWVKTKFGAVDLKLSTLQVGEVVRGVWRPGLFYDSDVEKYLGIPQQEISDLEQAIYILLERLQDIFFTVEPAGQNLNAFGHRTRDFLILACTEVENQWVACLRGANYNGPQRLTTNDFVRLKAPMHLSEYTVSMPRYRTVPAMSPFANWQASSPTNTLVWYDAYNKSKHDRLTNFALATLGNCLQAAAACIVLFAARLGPFRLNSGPGPLHSLYNNYFKVALTNPDPTSFYAPPIDIPSNQRHQFQLYNADSTRTARTSIPLTV